MSANQHRVVLQWVGDISLNEQFCSPAYHEFIRKRLAKLRDEAGPSDLRVGNFEAPLWGDGGVNKLKTPRLCTTKEAAECILPLGLNVVFLGNNHIYDCLETGFENTVRFLETNNIRFLGAGRSRQEASQPVILQRKGVSVAFLNYVHQNTHPSAPSDAGVFLNYFHEHVAMREISDLSHRVDIVVAYLHWGEEEFVRLPSLLQRRFGRQAIEAGATLVVFDHAHSPQPHERWASGHILYGLGNFIFGNVPGQDWPSQAYRTTMATIEVSAGCVNGVRLNYLCREGCVPQWDDQNARSRSQSRLDRCLRLPDRTYRLVYACERIQQKVIVPTLQFVKKSGGIIPSLFKVRSRHFKKVAAGMAIFARRTKGGSPAHASSEPMRSNNCLGTYGHGKA